MSPEHFWDTRFQSAKHIHLGAETTDIGLVQLHRRVACDDPFGQRLASATSKRDAARIHATEHEQPRDVWAFAYA